MGWIPARVRKTQNERKRGVYMGGSKVKEEKVVKINRYCQFLGKMKAAFSKFPLFLLGRAL